MNSRSRWSRVGFVIGATAFLAGAVDPLEGSVVILAGSALLLGSELLKGPECRHAAFWTSVFILIVVGVASMFGLSSVGGIGGDTGRSWWWGLLILPYPVGWIAGIVRLATAFSRGLRKRPGPHRGARPS